MKNSRITRIDWAPFAAQRPRAAGYNARLQVHGEFANMPVARLTTADGATGFGLCAATQEQAVELLGRAADDLLSLAPDAVPSLSELARVFEYPLWDLLGQRAEQPVYKLAADVVSRTADLADTSPLRVPCYDTSLYIDDLHLDSDAAAAALIASEAQEGQARGHTAFKIKVGRGARHMELEAGTRRDTAVIRAVRAAVGADATIMIDANNGYNLNLAKRVLAETAECNLFWLEEAFHEDRVLYADLREWAVAQKLDVLIADGEGQAAPSLLDWARDGVVDVIQYDIFSHGFANWLDIGAQLDAWSVRSAPHHYGRCLGNFVSGHLAAAVAGFTFVEWDEATAPVLDAAAYRIEDGHVLVPDLPGFGLRLDEAVFVGTVAQEGYSLSLKTT